MRQAQSGVVWATVPLRPRGPTRPAWRSITGGAAPGRRRRGPDGLFDPRSGTIAQPTPG